MKNWRATMLRAPRRDELPGGGMDVPEERIMTDAFDVGIRIHRALGPGLYEPVCEDIFCHEMAKLGYSVKRQVEVGPSGTG